jgi:Trypsin-co-occurring domain 2
MADTTVGLAAAIAALRKELLAAMDEGRDAPMRFRLSPVELSLQVAVTKEAQGKIGWQVLGLGGSYSSGTTQTLVLRLEPLWRQDSGSYTGDFAIADQGTRTGHVGPLPPEGRS